MLPFHTLSTDPWQERAHYASELEALIEQTEPMLAERAQVG